MVKKRYYFLFFILLLSIYFIVNWCRRRPRVHSYYFKEANFKFQIVEKDSCDLLVLDNSDTVFYRHHRFNLMVFFLSADSHTIYLNPQFGTISHQTENKYVVKPIHWSVRSNPLEPYVNGRYWGFYGVYNEGVFSYKFVASRNKRFYGVLHPSEKK